MAEVTYPEQLVFGLDIGTRSIVGTVGYLMNDRFCIVAQKAKEHETRAMLDGQIHDIGKVASTIAAVKKELEFDLGRPLHDVSIAAAGRVLKTVNVHVEEPFETEREITDEDVYALNSQGIEKAYESFCNENAEDDMQFYCVGYSVVRYYLNDYPMGNLVGHKGKLIGADLIATFLPDDVVDGLYKAVELADLKVVNMTLEPIAAIGLAIPEMYRMLNIALVDVGAGTSDISITKDGTIIAFGMIPMAGDGLTEVIAKHCLVDFVTAEQIKRAATTEDVIHYQDIMGLDMSITKEDLLKVTDPVIEGMTQAVADKIKELNGGKSVSAVFVVGGGGKLPGYTDRLAEKLELQKERVAVRGEQVMQKIDFIKSDLTIDSLLVTPIGICLSFYEQSNNFIYVSFNDKRVKIYDNSKLAVIDAALQAQFTNEDLFPKRGAQLQYTVNGVTKLSRGEAGESAKIIVNGKDADIHTPIKNNDQITVIPSTTGAPAKMTIGQLPEYGSTMDVFVQGKKVTLPKFVLVNGVLQSEYYEIQNFDKIEFQNYYSVEQILQFMDIVLAAGTKILVNSGAAELTTPVYEKFKLDWDEAGTRYDSSQLTYADLPEADEEVVYEKKERPNEMLNNGLFAGMNLNVSGFQAQAGGFSNVASSMTQYEETKPFQAVDKVQQMPLEQPVTNNIQQQEAQFGQPESVMKEAQTKQAIDESQPEREVTGDIHVIVNKMPIFLQGKPSFVYVDVFDYIKFDLSRPRGNGIVTLLNGKNAQYMETLHEGDIIEIYWKE